MKRMNRMKRWIALLCLVALVGPASGQKSCMVEHVGQVVSGRAKVKMDDGSEYDLLPGDCFYVPPGHDSWVEGDEPYVSLHFMGAEDYAH